jgi:hypothetical protein
LRVKIQAGGGMEESRQIARGSIIHDLQYVTYSRLYLVENGQWQAMEKLSF